MRGIIREVARNTCKQVLIFFTGHQIAVGQNRFAEIGQVRVAIAINLDRNPSFRLEKIMFRLHQI